MNPNASVFVPSMRADPAEQRVSQIQFLTKQIEYTKQELAVNNGELVKLHNELTTEHTQLIDEMQRRENSEYPCCTQEQIDYLAEDYKQRSAVYYTKYTQFNDKTSELVTLQQKLHRLLLAPMPPSTNLHCEHAASAHHHNQQPLHQQLHTDSPQPQQTQTLTQIPPLSHSNSSNNNNNNNMQHEQQSVAASTESDESQSSQGGRLSLLDGIDMNYSYSPPPATPHSVLPPIMESDAEYPWMEMGTEMDMEMDMDMYDDNASPNTNTSNSNSSQPRDGVQHLDVAMDSNCNAKQLSSSPIDTNANLHAKCANQAYSDCNKENIDPAHLSLSNKHGDNNDHDNGCQPLQFMKFNTHSVIAELSNLSVSEPMITTTTSTPSNAMESSQGHEQTARDGLDYSQLESEVSAMLENMMYCDIETICVEFNKFVHGACTTHKSLELLIDRIISHGIANKPEFFGTKYSLLCQSIVTEFHDHSNNNNNSGSNSKQQANDSQGDEWTKVRQRVNLKEMIWNSCFDAFKRLQFGNDGEKFINVMIIIAELLNAELISAQQVFNNVFKLILSDCNTNLCENDIEGLYEIFKRCHRSLITPQNKIHLHKYFHVLDKIKNLEKFKTGMHRVPFMVNQMKGFANKANQYQYSRKW